MSVARIQQLTTVHNEAKELFIKKNTDYGDAFANHGTIGILVRLGDKIQRLQSITKTGITLVQDEKMRDTLIDLHNYAAMGIMLLDENNTSVSDSEPVVNIWEVKGSRGFCYERQCFVDKYGDEKHTCSCPSFKYCKSGGVKTCKHIENS